MDRIAYAGGYRYQLRAPYTVRIEIRPACMILSAYITLTPEGVLSIRQGYAWDGATGCPDWRSIMRGSLVHDALYQLIREGHLPPECRATADSILRRLCLEDGLPAPLAAVVHAAVRRLGEPAADPAASRPTLYAP